MDRATRPSGRSKSCRTRGQLATRERSLPEARRGREAIRSLGPPCPLAGRHHRANGSMVPSRTVRADYAVDRPGHVKALINKLSVRAPVSCFVTRLWLHPIACATSPDVSGRAGAAMRVILRSPSPERAVQRLVVDGPQEFGDDSRSRPDHPPDPVICRCPCPAGSAHSTGLVRRHLDGSVTLWRPNLQPRSRSTDPSSPADPPHAERGYRPAGNQRPLRVILAASSCRR